MKNLIALFSVVILFVSLSCDEDNLIINKNTNEVILRMNDTKYIVDKDTRICTMATVDNRQLLRVSCCDYYRHSRLREHMTWLTHSDCGMR